MRLDTDESEPELKVIPISAAIGAELEITKKKEANHKKCWAVHKHVQVCAETRTLTCIHCGYVVDPFDYVLRWANEGERRMERLKGLDIQIRISHQEHEDLKRRINNIRGVLKRGGSPQTAVDKNEFEVMRLNPHRISALEK